MPMKESLSVIAHKLSMPTGGIGKTSKSHFVKVMKKVMKNGDLNGMPFQFVQTALRHPVDLSPAKTDRLVLRLLNLKEAECKDLVISYVLKNALEERTPLNFSKHIVGFGENTRNLQTASTLKAIRELKEETKQRTLKIDSLNITELLDCSKTDCMALKTVTVRAGSKGMGKPSLESIFTCSACNRNYTD